MICTLRTDCTPARLVALERQGRKAWPTMVSRFEARIQRYGGIARHDSTGLGDVVAGYLTTPAWGVRLVGRTRSDLFSNCISGIERGSLGAPRITFMYKEQLYRRIGDLYGAGHPPDSFVAGSLAAIECGVHQCWLPVDQAPKPKTEPYFYVDRDGAIPLSAPDAFTPAACRALPPRGGVRRPAH